LWLDKPVIYSLLVLSSPVSGHGSRHAAQFARCLISRGHTIHRIFFLDSAVEAASEVRVLPQDETDVSVQWIQLAEQHAVELIICVSSALKYGMLNQEEAKRHDRGSATVHPAFTISGLGQLIDASAHSDRLVTFGG
jgi:tRNA 2-thiouridine synthesizing protein D